MDKERLNYQPENNNSNFDERFDREFAGDQPQSEVEASEAANQTQQDQASNQTQQEQTDNQERSHNDQKPTSARVDYTAGPEQETGRDGSQIPADTATDKAITGKGVSRRKFLLGSLGLAGAGLTLYMLKGGGCAETSESILGRGLGRSFRSLANQGYEPFDVDQDFVARGIAQGRDGAVNDYLIFITDVADDSIPKNKNIIANREQWNSSMKEMSKAVDEMFQEQGVSTDGISEWTVAKGYNPDSAKWLERFVKLYKNEQNSENLKPQELEQFKAYYLQNKPANLLGGPTWP